MRKLKDLIYNIYDDSSLLTEVGVLEHKIDLTFLKLNIC